MKIPLNGKVGKGFYAEVDDVDGHLVELSWSFFQDEHRRYVYAWNGSKTVYMHSLILPKKAGYVIDHIDGDGLNNRRSNLRYVTTAQNSANARLSKRNKSGVKGLSLDNNHGYFYWLACIHKNGVSYRKRFPVAEKQAAADWLKEMRVKLHGEFARFG